MSKEKVPYWRMTAAQKMSYDERKYGAMGGLSVFAIWFLILIFKTIL